MHATLVAEDFAGMRAQACGLAERAGMSWDFLSVQRPTGGARLWPNAFSVRQARQAQISRKTQLFISVGGRGGAVGRELGKLYGLPVVQVQNPRRNLKDFTLVIANAHDRLMGDNVVEVRTALHGVTGGRLTAARREWRDRLSGGLSNERQTGTQRKLLGVLLGGPNGRYRFGEKEAADLAQCLGGFLRATEDRLETACVLVPSRRTSPKALRVLEEILAPLGARVMGKAGEENPYVGVLACADLLAVTNDSVSMISEAAATSVPIGILKLPGASTRLSAFVRDLEKAGRVQDFGNMSFSSGRREKLDDTSLAAREMLRRLERLS